MLNAVRRRNNLAFLEGRVLQARLSPIERSPTLITVVREREQREHSKRVGESRFRSARRSGGESLANSVESDQEKRRRIIIRLVRDILNNVEYSRTSFASESSICRAVTYFIQTSIIRTVPQNFYIIIGHHFFAAGIKINKRATFLHLATQLHDIIYLYFIYYSKPHYPNNSLIRTSLDPDWIG